MTITEAAESMRQAARKMRAWANALPKFEKRDEAQLFERVLNREALRLEQDANELAPAPRATVVETIRDPAFGDNVATFVSMEPAR